MIEKKKQKESSVKTISDHEYPGIPSLRIPCVEICSLERRTFLLGSYKSQIYNFWFEKDTSKLKVNSNGFPLTALLTSTSVRSQIVFCASVEHFCDHYRSAHHFICCNSVCLTRQNVVGFYCVCVRVSIDRSRDREKV